MDPEARLFRTLSNRSLVVSRGSVRRNRRLDNSPGTREKRREPRRSHRHVNNGASTNELPPLREGRGVALVGRDALDQSRAIVRVSVVWRSVRPFGRVQDRVPHGRALEHGTRCSPVRPHREGGRRFEAVSGRRDCPHHVELWPRRLGRGSADVAVGTEELTRPGLPFQGAVAVTHQLADASSTPRGVRCGRSAAASWRSMSGRFASPSSLASRMISPAGPIVS
jgi:hypothetical protein